MNIRPSRVLQKLRAGEVVTCTKLNLADPRVAEIAGLSGFDCIWLDLEHVPNTLHDLENQIRAAKTQNVDTIVRVPRGSASDLLYPFEMDAAGIMVPHVMSLGEVKDLVRVTRFHPLGRRPLDGGNADGAYCGVPLSRYIEQCNEQRFVAVQIEDPEVLADLEDIAELPGIDMLFFGPGDFSQGIGVPGRVSDPRVTEARVRVAECARRHGKFAGTVSALADVPTRVAEGYRFISVGADVVALGQYFRDIVQGFASHSARGDGEQRSEAVAVDVYATQSRLRDRAEQKL